MAGRKGELLFIPTNRYNQIRHAGGTLNVPDFAVYTHLDFLQIQKKMEEVQEHTKIG